MDHSDECSICTESYTRYRKMTSCMHCDLKCCTVCASTYVESAGVTHQCMQCHRPWNHQYIRENFGSSFIKKMANARKDVLFNEQKMYFPDTQEYVNLKNELRSFHEALNWNQTVYDRVGQINVILSRIENPIRGVNYPGEDVPAGTTVVTKTYIKPCEKDECKGYVNSENNACEICKTQYCSKCMEENFEGHVCKKENILTVTMLRKDTKSCPKCAVLIHRMSGCLDMFCVSCKTAFDWNTMNIHERGNSNPHYYQWLHESSKTSNGSHIPACGREINDMFAFNSTNYKKMTKDQQNSVMCVLYGLHHYQRTYNATSFYKEYKNTKRLNHSFRVITLKSRAEYMMNEITKETFQQILLKYHKAIEYNQNIDEIKRNILEFRHSLVQNIAYSTEFEFDVFMQMSKNFAKYINNCVSHLEEVFYTKKDKLFITTPILCS